MTSDVVAFAAYLLVPIVTAVLGVLGVMFQDWRAHRNQGALRKATLEDARLQVSFAIEWWDAKKQISDSPEAVIEAGVIAARWLDEASTHAISLQGQDIANRPAITVGRVLLFYRMRGFGANVVRSLFYISLAWLVVFSISAIMDALGPGKASLGADLSDLLITALLVLGLRFWAASIQKHQVQ